MNKQLAIFVHFVKFFKLRQLVFAACRLESKKGCLFFSDVQIACLVTKIMDLFLHPLAELWQLWSGAQAESMHRRRGHGVLP